jgi:hypothetical protein
MKLTKKDIEGLTATQKKMALIRERVNGIENFKEFIKKCKWWAKTEKEGELKK